GARRPAARRGTQSRALGKCRADIRISIVTCAREADDFVSDLGLSRLPADVDQGPGLSDVHNLN
ncbi:MAG: hypothetical protein OEW21_13490, partial [Betaproteobacteria bacterium]|nr:hypothetical protein [Betaproteobacteria bacterium]